MKKAVLKNMSIVSRGMFTSSVSKASSHGVSTHVVIRSLKSIYNKANLQSNDQVPLHAEGVLRVDHAPPCVAAPPTMIIIFRVEVLHLDRVENEVHLAHCSLSL